MTPANDNNDNHYYVIIVRAKESHKVFVFCVSSTYHLSSRANNFEQAMFALSAFFRWYVRIVGADYLNNFAYQNHLSFEIIFCVSKRDQQHTYDRKRYLQNWQQNNEA